ncbi:MAG: molybdopterin-dependent oxidoreductase [Desulfarculaceae bacterium]|nr:molybdopterin-dependent oxidoreductase [Desulfarculaceae bacterium]MCF8072189.1 molybdopterin-dependent oxidoreductase [Desulfarculaceae bacterium]MCF8117241.1 molybdopterin-dependent oxidoreductase [Desulfarculaceae bacterium]
MQWDRRAFIKLAVGGVLGVHASPLVWKLMDDSTIWTQNWSWVPVPEDGEVAFANTVSPQTGNAVQTRLVLGRVDGTRAIRVEGNPDHPLGKGGVVPEDSSALQLLYNDDIRVKTPLMRDKATGRIVPLSWPEALDLLSGNLAELVKKGKPEGIMALGHDPDSTTSQLLMSLMAALGSPNVAFTPDARETLALAGLATMGQTDLGFDLANADFVVSFGTPLLENFGNPVATRKAFASWRAYPKNSGYLAQIEPRASVTASQADLWLACNPGTEGALAMAMCAIMIQEGLYDQQAVGAAFGFEDEGDFPGFKSYVLKNYPREQVAAMAGVPLSKLLKLTLDFAKAKRAVAVCGPGPSGGPGRMYDFMAVLALNALKGNIGKPGGVLVQGELPLKPLGEASLATKVPPLVNPALGLDQNNPHAMAEAALTGKPYGINTLLLVGGNFMYNGPSAGTMQKLARQTPFVVAITPFLDESAAVADLVLPSTHWLEGWGDSVSPFGSPVASYGLHLPLIKAVPEAKDAGEILLSVAARLGGKPAKALPYKNVEEALAVRSEALGDFEKLAEQSYWVQEKPNYGAIQFNTPSGKFEFFSLGLFKLLSGRAGNPTALAQMVAGMGVSGGLEAAFLPHWEPPAAADDLGTGMPLLLQAVPSLRTTWGGDAITPYMVKVLPDTMLADKDKLVVEMNPATAHELHLYEGDMVRVDSTAGSLIAKVHLFEGASPGMVFAPVGLGHQAFGFQVADKGMNFNNAAKVTSDPMSGLPIWELTAVSVEKV